VLFVIAFAVEGRVGADEVDALVVHFWHDFKVVAEV
jgi:hypothetical protein